LVCLVLAAVPRALAQSPAGAAGDVRFVILQHGTPIGTATSAVSRTADGWSIVGTTQLNAPLQVSVNRVEVGYTSEWAPRNATLDLVSSDESVVVHGGGFGGPTAARIDIVRGGRQVTFVTAQVSRDALILPNFAYAAYEALAARLETAVAGTRIAVYVMPQREIAVRVDAVTAATLRGSGTTAATKHYRVTFVDPTGDTAADVWTEAGRLAGFDLPSQELSVRRVDLNVR
jgi:hypothetical protein